MFSRFLLEKLYVKLSSDYTVPVYVQEGEPSRKTQKSGQLGKRKVNRQTPKANVVFLSTGIDSTELLQRYKILVMNILQIK